MAEPKFHYLRKVFPIDLMPKEIAKLTNAFEIEDHGRYVMIVGAAVRGAKPGTMSETWINRHKALDAWLVSHGTIDGEIIEIEGWIISE